MASDEEVGTLTDRYGDRIVVSTLTADLAGDVCIQFYSAGEFIGMWLTPEQQEEFAQLYVAACHQAKANAEAGRKASGMNAVERAARALIGIPDGL